MTQKVLVSGASGYVAAHVLKQLLNKNYFVRATVRSQAKADIIAAKYVIPILLLLILKLI